MHFKYVIDIGDLKRGAGSWSHQDDLRVLSRDWAILAMKLFRAKVKVILCD